MGARSAVRGGGDSFPARTGASVLGTLGRGVAAGFAATLVQTAVGKASEKLLRLPPREDSNIAPRLMHRLAAHAGHDLSSPAKWALGTVFHFGYGASWGALYGMARERRPVHPLPGGALLAGLIYGITFPRWGGAVQTGTERPPERRTDRMTLTAASVTLAFGLTTAYAYERLSRPARTSGTQV